MTSCRGIITFEKRKPHMIAMLPMSTVRMLINLRLLRSTAISHLYPEKRDNPVQKEMRQPKKRRKNTIIHTIGST